jgi:hypothetical protein
MLAATMKQLALLALVLPLFTTACSKKKEDGGSGEPAKTVESKPKEPEKPIELTETADLGAAVKDPDDKSFVGIKVKTPAGAKIEPGLTGLVVRIGERQAYEISKAYEPGAHVPKVKKEAQEDTLDKLVKFHVDTPDAILWEDKSELGGDNNFGFAAEVKVGDATYKCFNKGYGNFTKSQAEALLKSCQSASK